MKKGIAKVATEVRREQITQATFNVIARQGVKGLTVAAIAKKAGISEANLYRHFKNKDDILRQAVENVGAGLLENLRRIQDASADEPLVRLRNLFMMHLGYIEENEGIPRLVFSEEIHLVNHEFREKLLSAINSYAQGVESFVRAGQTNGSIHSDADASAVALIFIGMIQISTLKWSLNDFSFCLIDEGMRLWDNFERCITSTR
ncbi:MAG: TetR/AcrR family transcriptional regulator [Syntrophales bacterium]|jgi:AcrR family transcriptional regulator|nr:TetR/AcrR family transcriptional regulator [Syntrophales bacterium]